MTSQNGKTRRPQTAHKGNIYSSLSPDRVAAFEKAVEVIGSQKAADAKAFNDRQRELALEAPVLSADRANGGVDGYARDLAIRLIEGWAVAVKTEAQPSRFGTAKTALTDALFDETKAAVMATGASEEEAIVKAATKIANLKGVLYHATNAARKAVDYAFEAAKKEKAAAHANA